jgi:hypothetical protein
VPRGVLSVTHELPIRDLEVLDPGPFMQQMSGSVPWTGTLAPSAAGLELLIEIPTNDPSLAADFAEGHARALADHLTLWLCRHDISQRVVPRRLGSPQFQSDEPNSLHVFMGELTLVGHAVTVRVTRRVHGQTFADGLADFAARQVAPPPVTATDLVVAREMFLAGLAVENRVASFLISYAALAAFAAFKGGPGRPQARIDNILRAEDQSIAMVTRTNASGGTTQETEFTAARNVFIHSEDRGRDPATALASLESLTPRLNALVGRVLLRG